MKWAVVGLYAIAILYIHTRGQVRLPWLRQLFDHSSIVAPLNMLMVLLSRPPATPYFAVGNFAELRPLQAHWEQIRTEALNLIEQGKIKAAEKNDDAGFNSFFKNGWKRFYLKWYDASHPSAALFCPYTVALLRAIPSVKAAMFAELPAGGKLNPHRDPYAGSLRYHLGLVTPNSELCFIEVDGQRYSWRDGEGVVFDETFLHWAQNGSDSNRIILFCDIERPMRYGWAQRLNKWLGKTMMTSASSPNEVGDQTGGINKLFRFVWSAGQYRRRLKAWNRAVYYGIKAALIVAVGLFVIFV